MANTLSANRSKYRKESEEKISRTSKWPADLISVPINHVRFLAQDENESLKNLRFLGLARRIRANSPGGKKK